MVRVDKIYSLRRFKSSYCGWITICVDLWAIPCAVRNEVPTTTLMLVCPLRNVQCATDITHLYERKVIFFSLSTDNTNILLTLFNRAPPQKWKLSKIVPLNFLLCSIKSLYILIVLKDAMKGKSLISASVPPIILCS